MRKQSMAELSAFKCYADSLDTLQMERCLHSLLDSDTSHWKADRAVKQRYKDSKDFLWFSNMGVSADADSMLNILRKELPLAGLDTTAFYVPQISGYLHTVHQLAFDSLRTSINEVLPRLDYLLSKAFVRYTVGQRYGFIRPDKLFNQLEHKNNADNEEFAHLFDYETKAPDYEEGFRALTSEQRLDYMRGSRPQGKVYEAFRSMMDSLSDTERRSQLAINMERCRWQLKRPDSDERKVIVNIPTLQLWAVCPDSVLNMRICCGAVTNKTPLLCSEISHFNVNPDWIVPLNIVKSDFLRHAGDSAYFARNRYYIVERGSGDTLNPVQVTADEMQSGRLRIGQKSGAGNSLGHIVFRFPNDFGIYLHDTNNRKAFTYARRTLSHGCIRVQKPLELACFMLPEADEWLTDRLRLSMDLPPLTEQGINYLNEHADDERPLRLLTYQPVSPKIPVYIIYYTVYPNPATSRIEYWPDLYGYDKAIEKELGVLLQKR
jgi:murein L,D-transpeptidase YcbB/YkuD